jgi:hypothetical protein
MATLALVAVGLLALLVFVLFGAMLELYKDVRQLRDAAGILDRPLHVDVGLVAGTAPSAYGLPQVLDTATSALVLFLSETCSTCRALAASFDTSLPPGLWVVLEARSADSAREFLATYRMAQMTSESRVSVDLNGEIAGRIGLDTTPVGFRVENGLLTSATTVPSTRYLMSILPTPIQLKPNTRHSANGENYVQHIGISRA